MTSTVDGLVSGLDTTSLVSQLMTVEAATQTQLKNKVTTAQTAVAAYQSVNSKLTALKSAADTMGQLSTWRGIQATSSSSSVAATALVGTNGSAGTATFNVTQLAKSQITTARVDSTAAIDVGDTITVHIGPLGGTTTPYTIDLSTIKVKTAKAVADAINAAGIGVKAAVVTTGGDQNILQLGGTKTGSANAFTIEGIEALSPSNVADAGSAELQIGGGEGSSGGYNVISDTNTFTGLMPGVSLTVSALEKGITVSATSDVGGMAGKIQAMVDAANATLTEIGNQTAYDASSRSGSPLTGDFSIRQMSQKILAQVSMGVAYTDPSTGKTKQLSLKELGIQLDSTGQLSFNAADFASAYAADPAKIQKIGIVVASGTWDADGKQLTDGFEQLAAKQTTAVTSVITGRSSEIDGLTSQISDWDIRLAAKKTALQKQYSDLEVALGKLKNQSTWLTGQLAGLS